MSMNIRIVKMPLGFAPEEIRAQWVGVEIPYTPGEHDSLQGGTWVGEGNENGYVVATDDAIESLVNSGKVEAAEYLNAILSFGGGVLRFGKEYCEVCER